MKKEISVFQSVDYPVSLLPAQTVLNVRNTGTCLFSFGKNKRLKSVSGIFFTESGISTLSFQCLISIGDILGNSFLSDPIINSVGFQSVSEQCVYIPQSDRPYIVNVEIGSFKIVFLSLVRSGDAAGAVSGRFRLNFEFVEEVDIL